MTVATATSGGTSVVVSESGAKGLDGTDGTDGIGFNQVRQSKLDNPLLHLFKTNQLSAVSAPLNTDADVTWTRASTATYVDRYGVVQSSAIDTPREEKEGWLIEGASTNTFLYSEDLDDGVSNVTTTSTCAPVATTAPDGTSTMDKFIPDTGATTAARVAQTGVITSTGTWCLSNYFKAGEFTTAHMEIYSLEDDSGITEFTLAGEGEVLSTNAPQDSSGIEYIGNGIYRCWIVKTFTGTTNNQVNPVRIATADVASADSSKGYYCWGAQVEKLPFASSYIPTTSASVTRAADLVELSGVNNTPLLSGAHSMTVSALTTAVGLTRYIFAVDNTSITDRLLSYGSNSVNLENYISGTNTQMTIADTTIPLDIATAYDGSNITGYVNGETNASAVVAYTASTVPDVLYIGQDHVGNYHLYGHLKDLRIYDFALNADEAQYLAD